MNGKSWLKCFAQVIEAERKLSGPSTTSPKDSEWTEFMQKVMDIVAVKMNCWVARLRPEDKARSGEYLNIDAFFVDNAAFNPKNKLTGYDPFVLPRAVVELENSFDINKISYCLWKILCIRAPIRVLVCYQSDSTEVQKLRQHLEEVIQAGSLMKDTTGDLLVIIGNESVKEWKSYFRETFSAFEWRNDRLEKA